MHREKWMRYGAIAIVVASAACGDGEQDSSTYGFDGGFAVDAEAVLPRDAGAMPFLDATLVMPPSVDAMVAADTGTPLDASPLRDARVPVPVAGDSGMPVVMPDAAAGNTAEPARLAGITAAHNMVRAMVQSSTPLPPLEWSPTLAAYAQQWADMQAAAGCTTAMHRSSADLSQKGYGENLAVIGGFALNGFASTPQQAVKGWADEVMCWTYGTITGFGRMGTEMCSQSCYQALHSDGCGHYTQIVWRKTTQLGCGVASCNSGRSSTDVWICNYSPPGNYAGQAPY